MNIVSYLKRVQGFTANTRESLRELLESLDLI